MTIWTGATPILYHGTTRRNWSRIRRNGFRLSKSGHYLGHGVCLSESIAVAYAHGAYEDGGVVLEVCLPEGTRWSEGGAGDLDRWLADGPADATRAYGGNVWVMWPLRIAPIVRALRRSEAYDLLRDAFAADGRGIGYNGAVQGLAEMYWSAQAGE